jgi:hypothetical protein
MMGAFFNRFQGWIASFLLGPRAPLVPRFAMGWLGCGLRPGRSVRPLQSCADNATL